VKPPLTPQQRLDRTVTEAELQEFVREAAGYRGWIYHHETDSRRSTAGLPDCILVRAPRVIFAELKTEIGRVSQAQQAWLDELELCKGVEVYLWRPSMLTEILDTLA
jgi:hypothetical protein